MSETFIPAYDADENALLAIEESWADYQRGLRTGMRARIDEGRASFRGASLKQVGAALGVHRTEFHAGDKAALIDALRVACDEGVPLPYWLADGIRAALDQLHGDASKTLHDVFGMERRYSTTSKRALKSRADMHTKQELYMQVSKLIARGMGKTAAIKQVTRNLPIEFRKAFDWFTEMDARQQRHLDAWHERKLHKLR